MPSMSPDTPERQLVTPEMVAQLALLAELPLPADRREAVAEQLNGLLVEANLVNRFMDERRYAQPGVRFHHSEPERDGH